MQRGLGFTILPSYLRYDYGALDLMTIDLVKPKSLRDLVVVKQRNAVHPPATLALIAMIRESLSPR